ncbi:hypothetical protein AVEN_111039-1 [Araneus ventricosus]|uniref:Uncharacterized protein n=1 Tax=Araneus ventricosus TaxID=182803 RepID=A0A4Y2JYJ5_ARAVE|nr:hypothetical protein AVEN_111039-1 [Araneus ventricosus]
MSTIVLLFSSVGNISLHEFYPPQREMEHKTAIAQSNLTNPLLQNLSVPLDCVIGRPEGHNHPWFQCSQVVPSIDIKRNVTPLCVISRKLSDIPDSNFSLQQACHKFVMTRVQVCHKFVMTSVQACSKLAAS